jgi:hypothetical protein
MYYEKSFSFFLLKSVLLKAVELLPENVHIYVLKRINKIEYFSFKYLQYLKFFLYFLRSR